MYIKHFLVCVKRKLSLEDTELIAEIREKKQSEKYMSFIQLNLIQE